MSRCQGVCERQPRVEEKASAETDGTARTPGSPSPPTDHRVASPQVEILHQHHLRHPSHTGGHLCFTSNRLHDSRGVSNYGTLYPVVARNRSCSLHNACHLASLSVLRSTVKSYPITI